MRYRLGLLLILLVVYPPPTPASAQHNDTPRPVLPEPAIPEPLERWKLSLGNMGLTGVLALTRGIIEGRVENAQDGAVLFATGAVGGWGFYRAKRLIGERQATAGMALAFAATSLTENVIQGEHPLAYVRAGPGPFDLRLRTPLARDEGPAVTVEINPLSAAALVALPLIGLQTEFYGGTIIYRNNGPLGAEGHKTRHGVAMGRVIVLDPSANSTVRAHELIHYVQSLQMQSVTPFSTLGAVYGGLPVQSSPHLQWDIQLETLYSIFSLANMLVPYDRRWIEIEAFTLQQGLSVDG